MTLDQAFKYFKGKKKLAEKLDISPSAVSQWISKGRIPYGRQCEIQVLTKGRLKASISNGDNHE